MAQDSKIQWTQDTWNPWHGCKKVSEGCRYCYMYRDKEKYGQDPYNVYESKSGTFLRPLRIKEHRLIFTCSWSDFFIEEADQLRPKAWEIIKKTPWHTYQILTKRPERIMDCLPDDWGDGYDNVWLGVSVENRMQVSRIWVLNRVPAKIRFVSFEPLLEYIDMNLDLDDLLKINWVIIGGESGNNKGKYKYRPCKIEWIESLISDLKITSNVFVKQLGTHIATELELKDRHGGNIDEWPCHLKIREMPNSSLLNLQSS